MKEETLVAIIALVIFFVIILPGIFSEEEHHSYPTYTVMEDPSKDLLSTGENINISIPYPSYVNEYWEVEYSLGHYYLIRREDYDADFGGYLDNEREIVLYLPY